jgi:hypothetical protein
VTREGLQIVTLGHHYICGMLKSATPAATIYLGFHDRDDSSGGPGLNDKETTSWYASNAMHMQSQN